jgi:syntaxin-binding protein 1
MKVLDLGGVGSKAIPNGLRDPREKRSYQEYYDEKYFLKDAPPPPPPPVQPVREDRTKLIPRMQASPAPSRGGSTLSVNSVGTAGKEEKEKKKKKGLFRF